MRRARVVAASRRNRLDSILHVLVDSGLTYTALWMVLFGLSLRPVYSNGSNTVYDDSPGFPIGWLQVLMSAVVPIYPMWIMILVTDGRDDRKSVLSAIDPVTIQQHTLTGDTYRLEEYVRKEEHLTLIQ